MYKFYMVVPALVTVLLDVVLPYGVALKMVSALGLVALPVCCWAFGKLAALPFPIPPLFAIASTFFLFDWSFTIYGGNVASTMAGEFSFSLALCMSMLYLGVLARGMRTGKGRALAAGLFALTVLCHLIVGIFAAVATLLMFVLWADRKRTRYLVTMLPVAGLLTAFWTLPFLFGGAYMTDMTYERRPVGNAPNGLPDSYWQMLFRTRPGSTSSCSHWRPSASWAASSAAGGQGCSSASWPWSSVPGPASGRRATCGTPGCCPSCTWPATCWPSSASTRSSRSSSATSGWSCATARPAPRTRSGGAAGVAGPTAWPHRRRSGVSAPAS
jgi:hypothetical protein